MIGDEEVSIKISTGLLKMGVFVQAIRYPTVKRGNAQLRVSITAKHTTEELDFAISCLEKIDKKFKLL
jgi:7-keto-8-aminopelargonate synthetase-like enzyme